MQQCNNKKINAEIFQIFVLCEVVEKHIFIAILLNTFQLIVTFYYYIITNYYICVFVHFSAFCRSLAFVCEVAASVLCRNFENFLSDKSVLSEKPVCIFSFLSLISSE